MFAEDSYPERLSKVLVEILNANAYGMDSGATIELPQPLPLSIYDNDCKYAPFTYYCVITIILFNSASNPSIYH